MRKRQHQEQIFNNYKELFYILTFLFNGVIFRKHLVEIIKNDYNVKASTANTIIREFKEVSLIKDFRLGNSYYIEVGYFPLKKLLNKKRATITSHNILLKSAIKFLMLEEDVKVFGETYYNLAQIIITNSNFKCFCKNANKEYLTKFIGLITENNMLETTIFNNSNYLKEVKKRVAEKLTKQIIELESEKNELEYLEDKTMAKYKEEQLDNRINSLKNYSLKELKNLKINTNTKNNIIANALEKELLNLTKNNIYLYTQLVDNKLDVRFYFLNTNVNCKAGEISKKIIMAKEFIVQILDIESNNVNFNFVIYSVYGLNLKVIKEILNKEKYSAKFLNSITTQEYNISNTLLSGREPYQFYAN